MRHIEINRTPRWVTAPMALIGAAALAIASAVVAPFAAAAGTVHIEARVLVVDDGSSTVGAVMDRMTAEGQQYERVDLNAAGRQVLTEDFLATNSASAVTAHFSGVVLPNESPAQLTADERSTLFSYEAAFNVRQLTAYTWAHPEVGLNYAAGPGYIGTLDGLTATLTDDALTEDFGYLEGSLELDDLSDVVSESYGYLARPLAGADFTPLVTARIPGTNATGSLVGVLDDGEREQMVITFAYNHGQEHWRVLSHGIINWLTRGISSSYNRNYLSVHVDDVLLPDGLWSEEGNCTFDDDCDANQYPPNSPGASARMVVPDVDVLTTWQQQQDLKLDLVFNAGGAAEAAAEIGGPDPLEQRLLQNKSEFRWVNHTWTHFYLGCEKDYSTTPWSCVTETTNSSAPAIKWVSNKTISSQIGKNISYAASHELPNHSAGVLVTGEHSGLKSAPQMFEDNPNLVTALNQNGIEWVASDASRESSSRTIGSATTVPRHPMNIFYNTATKSQAIDEYNWIYSSRANGGSGICEDNPLTTTCITPLDSVTGFDDYIVPTESRIAMSHVLDNDARPHYVHQSNLTGDRLIYPVLDSLMTKYGETFDANTPLVNPKMEDAGSTIVRHEDWEAAKNSTVPVISGTSVSVTNSSTDTLAVPLTLPAGATHSLGSANGGTGFGDSYGGQQSAWVSIDSAETVSYDVGDTGFVTTAVWPTPVEVPAGTPDSARLTEPHTEEIQLPEAKIELITTDEQDS